MVDDADPFPASVAELTLFHGYDGPKRVRTYRAMCPHGRQAVRRVPAAEIAAQCRAGDAALLTWERTLLLRLFGALDCDCGERARTEAPFETQHGPYTVQAWVERLGSV